MIFRKNTIYLGNALYYLKQFPSNSINQCITSPPYLWLRTYNASVIWERNGQEEWYGELGQEPTIQMYIDHLMLIFNQVKRVLTKDGSCWVVISDSSINKNMLMIPERFALAMKDNGWILRRKIIWQKGNVIPSSAKDAYTIDYENVYFFTKSENYHFKTQYQPYSSHSLSEFFEEYKGQGKKDYEGNNVQNPSDVKRRIIASLPKFGGNKLAGGQNRTYSGNEWEPSPFGSIVRTVWKINTKPSDIEHYAIYPEELVKRMIDAGCPLIDKRKRKGTILDPFIGSGTTALVALKMNRYYIGIEMNEEYYDIATDRINFIKEVVS